LPAFAEVVPAAVPVPVPLVLFSAVAITIAATVPAVDGV